MMHSRIRRRNGNAVASVASSVLGKAAIAVVLAGAALYGWHMFLKHWEKDKQALRDEITVARAERQDMKRQLDTANGNLNEAERRLALSRVTHRLARIDVLAERTVTENGREQVYKLIRFREVAERDVGGKKEEFTLGEVKELWLPGKKVIVDGKVMMFNDDDVEKGDFFRGTSLAMLERFYTDDMAPVNGIAIDSRGARPLAYHPQSAAATPATSGTGPGQDATTWSRFWDLAHNEPEQRRLGIRSMSGQVVTMRADVGRSYKVALRASGGLSITPEGRVQVMAQVGDDKLTAEQLRPMTAQPAPGGTGTTARAQTPVLSTAVARNGPPARRPVTARDTNDPISWESDGHLSQ